MPVRGGERGSRPSRPWRSAAGWALAPRRRGLCLPPPTLMFRPARRRPGRRLRPGRRPQPHPRRRLFRPQLRRRPALLLPRLRSARLLRPALAGPVPHRRPPLVPPPPPPRRPLRPPSLHPSPVPYRPPAPVRLPDCVPSPRTTCCWTTAAGTASASAAMTAWWAFPGSCRPPLPRRRCVLHWAPSSDQRNPLMLGQRCLRAPTTPWQVPP